MGTRDQGLLTSASPQEIEKSWRTLSTKEAIQGELVARTLTLGGTTLSGAQFRGDLKGLPSGPLEKAESEIGFHCYDLHEQRRLVWVLLHLAKAVSKSGPEVFLLHFDQGGFAAPGSLFARVAGGFLVSAEGILDGGERTLGLRWKRGEVVRFEDASHNDWNVPADSGVRSLFGAGVDARAVLLALDARGGGA